MTSCGTVQLSNRPVLLHTRHFFSNESSSSSSAGPSDSRGQDEEPDSIGRRDVVGSPDGQDEQDHIQVKADSAEHPDEEQVLRDTKRSFVTYPRGMENSPRSGV